MVDDDARVVTETGHVWVYNVHIPAWIDGGQFLGPKGDPGEPSTEPGPTGETGPEGKGYILITAPISPTFSNGNKFIQTTVSPSTTAYVVGSRVRIAYDGNNWLEGEIISLDTTGPTYGINVSVDKYAGTNGGGGGNED
jgi:hypothetical protein